MKHVPAFSLALAAQLAAAALGGYAFHLLDVPAAWLSGAVVGVVLFGLTGRARPMPRPLVDAGMLLNGITMGAGVTPEAIAAAGRYPFSLVLLILAVAAVTAGSALWLVRVSGWRRDDAILASVPGALTTVFAVAADRNAAVAPIAVVQAFRLFVLITILPSVVAGIEGGTPGAMPGEGSPVASPLLMGLVMLCGLAAGRGLERLGVAAPMLLGATLASAVGHGTGAAPGALPPVLTVAGFVLIGVFVGERFRTLDPAALRATLPAAMGSFVVGVAVSSAVALAAAAVARVPLAEALVAFAPGGLEAMMVLALVLGLDPLYVGTHHIARFVGIGVLLPLVFARLPRAEAPSGPQSL